MEINIDYLESCKASIVENFGINFFEQCIAEAKLRNNNIRKTKGGL